MAVNITTQPALIAECNTCHERSQPLHPANVDDWEGRHNARHHMEQFRARMSAAGHTITQEIEWMEPDDSGAHLTCTCGWTSPSSKINHMTTFGDNHLVDEASKLGLDNIPVLRA